MLSLLLCCLAGMAQDVIVCKDGTSLLGKVTEVTEAEVKYRKADNPDGPLYTLKIADLMRINYENGQSDIFARDGQVPSTVLAGPTGDVKDTDLLAFYTKKKADYSLPKKLKLTAFIGGGALIVTGVTLMAIGGFEFENSYGISGACIAGATVCGIGAAFIPTVYLIARHKQKKLNELASAPIYRQEIFAKDGKSLSMGVDFLADRVQTRTLGLGMTFKF